MAGRRTGHPDGCGTGGERRDGNRDVHGPGRCVRRCVEAVDELRDLDRAADGSPVQRAYLRFTVAGLAGQVIGATLRVYATSSLRSGLRHAAWRTPRGPSRPSTGRMHRPRRHGDRSPRVPSASAGSPWTRRRGRGNGDVSIASRIASSTAVGLRSREAGAATAPQLSGDRRAQPAAARRIRRRPRSADRHRRARR